jgi:transposase
MRKGIVVDVTAADRARLKAVVSNRNSSQKHVWRAKIILLTADGLGTNAVIRGTGRSKSVVWRWQERFMQEGVDGLLRDKTRPPGRKPLETAVIERVVAMTAQDPPAEVTHWTAGMMAKAAGISASSVQRIGSRAAAAPRAPVQAVQGPGFRPQAAGDRRPLCQSAAACDRALGR